MIMKNETKIVVLMSLFVIMIPFKVKADASYDGNASFTMLPQAAIVNTFGFGGPIYATAANANASPANIASGSALVGVGGGSVSGAPGTIINSGYTTYDSTVDSEATEQISFRLVNFTGSGGGSPPGQNLNVNLNYSYSFNLTTFADPPTANTYDAAEEALQIYYTASTRGGGSTQGTLENDYVDNGGSLSDSVSGSITLTLAPHSTTYFTATFALDGDAESESTPIPLPTPEPLIPTCVPEPTTLSLLALGALALLRRRQGKV